MAGAFNDKRRRLDVISGPTELRWGRIVTHVECVLEDPTQFIVIVAAAGNEPSNPSDIDIANAQLAAMVAWKQHRRFMQRKRTRALLRYPNGAQVEIDVDIKATMRRLNVYLASARAGTVQPTLPTPLLSYFLTR
tara:strand:+ start:17519 stop:17923 length:405 start_codon:yes stop_codon:yes gene_type:complete